MIRTVSILRVDRVLPSVEASARCAAASELFRL
jgi:hypothetical protein